MSWGYILDGSMFFHMEDAHACMSTSAVWQELCEHFDTARISPTPTFL